MCINWSSHFSFPSVLRRPSWPHFLRPGESAGWHPFLPISCSAFVLLGPGPLLSSGGFPESGTWLPWHLLFRFLIYFSFLLTYNSYAIKPSILKCGNEWFFVFSQCCTTTASIKFQNIFIAPKENSIPIKQSVSINSSSNPWKPPVCFLLLDLTYSGYFI